MIRNSVFLNKRPAWDFPYFFVAEHFMNILFLPILSVLLFWCAACAALPFLVLRDRRLARIRKRSLFDKSADQVSALCAIVMLLFAAALGADAFWHGRMDVVASSLGQPVWLLFVGGECLAAVLALCSRALAGRRTLALAATLLSGLAAALSYLLFLVLLWSLLRGEQIPGFADMASGADARSRLTALGGQFAGWVNQFSARADWALTAPAWGFFCFLAPAAAQLCALLWHVARRGADDFGRDYYTFAVGGRARRAAWSGALLLPFAALLLWVTPPFAAQRAAFLPFGNMGPELLIPLYNALPLGLPLAVLCCYLPGRSTAPLRRKSLIVLAPIMFFVGLFAMLTRLWG